MAPFYAIICGAGPGLGRSVALRFAQAYPFVILLSRSQSSYQPIVDEINSKSITPSADSGSKATTTRAIGFSSDASDPEAVAYVFDKIRAGADGFLPQDAKLAVALFNVNAGLVMKPFLETKVEDLDFGLAIPARGLYLFAQQALPLLQTSISASPVNPPTLLITGATASLRGSAKFGTFAAGMFAQRALGQSLAREFGPKGVHVALAVIDSGIDGPRMRAMLGEDAKKAVEEDKVMSPDAIAESHWHLHAQHRSSWTQELDLRPWQEKF